MRALLSVIGKDKLGIIAKVSNYLYELNINIEDISQTIMQDYFTMIMLVDTGKCKKEFSEISSFLEKKGEEFGVSIRIQSEEIFNAMHKI